MQHIRDMLHTSTMSLTEVRADARVVRGAGCACRAPPGLCHWGAGVLRRCAGQRGAAGADSDGHASAVPAPGCPQRGSVPAPGVTGRTGEPPDLPSHIRQSWVWPTPELTTRPVQAFEDSNALHTTVDHSGHPSLRRTSTVAGTRSDVTKAVLCTVVSIMYYPAQGDQKGATASDASSGTAKSSPGSRDWQQLRGLAATFSGTASYGSLCCC